MNERKYIAVTPGSENGVGPELMIRALCSREFAEERFFWCGDRRSLELACIRADLPLRIMEKNTAQIGPHVNLRFAEQSSFGVDPAERQALPLKLSANLVKNGQAKAIVTAPMEKSLLKFLGEYGGQTEFFAAHLAKEDQKPFMAFLGGPFMLSLLTTHVALKDVPSHVDKKRLLPHIYQSISSCAELLKRVPHSIRVEVLGLNPHAGEAGFLGQEEISTLKPIIELLKNEAWLISGPYAADGYFAYLHKRKELPDLVLAMYHDQGLIPYKILAQGRAVNVTMGLLAPRTSPAHGTAPELLGTSSACILSTLEALRYAIRLSDH
jgi:4-hydroxy-L-threonine phosphate dehydrogenase PdxA